MAFWDQYYKANDLPALELLETVARLRKDGKFQEIEAAIRGYLVYHGKRAQPWMYEMLAVAMEVNKAGADRVKEALGYAAQMAMQGSDPVAMIRVADLLVLRGQDDLTMTVRGRPVRVTVGALLDRAAEKAPHLPQPLLMSIQLARRTKDPKRMAVAMERLLSLGWPGQDASGRLTDEIWRAEVRRQAEGLARDLREDGREAEADALLADLPQAEARDLFLRLTWAGDADLDLTVEEPLGATARHETPRTVFGGAILKEGRGKHPEEIYVCPRGFDGDYKVRVRTIYNDPDRPVSEAKLEIITHEGLPDEHAETKTVALTKPPTPIVVHLEGGRRKSVLPYVAPPTMPAPVVRGAASRQPTSVPSSTTNPKPIQPDAGQVQPKASVPRTSR